MNSRVGYFAGQEPPFGDYQTTGDHELPAGELQQYFEACDTLNHGWGYNKFDDGWKPVREVVHQLVNTVSKGGNYLLDVGPDGEGTIPQPAVDILEKVGAWVGRNGESIYGTGRLL
jgi:alpha-L-fucosidase